MLPFKRIFSQPHGAGKGRGKKRKGPVRHPPPLLLVQDAQEALKRLQERVSALLLHSWPDSPPTPIRSPSRLPGQTGAAPLWQKSALLDCSTGPSDFYIPELRQFITPWEPTKVTQRNVYMLFTFDLESFLFSCKKRKAALKIMFDRRM